MLHNAHEISNFRTYSYKGIFHIVFCHKKRPYNILDMQTLDELNYILDNILDLKIHSGVIFKSSKTSFIVGANVKDFVSAHDAPDENIDKILTKGQDTFNKIEDLPIPTIAIINGITMGGGLELPLACSYRILIKDTMFQDQDYTPIPRTKLAFPEVKLGILPSWGGTTRLPRIINPMKAMEIICSGRNIRSAEALKLGLVDTIKLHHKALPHAYNIIRDIDYKLIRESKYWPVDVPKWKTKIYSFITKWVIGRKQKKMFGRKDKYPSPYKALDTFKAVLEAHRPEANALERKAFISLVKSDECKELVARFFNGERG
jgi:3-hydroxyacyl-CoA dehydrogenase/enoyl-CoA hydratase/3-hydroxybutyryl-CoA epimerase/enoyl-CoA isomerase